MEKKICPLCGKEINNGERFCNDCKQAAHDRENEPTLSDKKIEFIEDENGKITGQENPTLTPPSKTKISKKTIIFFIIILILFTGAGITAALVSKSNKLSKENETAYWEHCIEENTPLAYSKYLVTFPEGTYKNDAENRILAIRQSESKLWDRIKKSNNPDSLSYFLNEYPESPYRREAIKIIDSLAWIKTVEDNTADAYKAYIENVKLDNYTGLYIEEAKAKYDYLSTIIVLEGEELAPLKKYLNEMAKDLSSGKSKELIKTLQVDTLSNFFGQNQKDIQAIIDSLQNDNKKQKIKSVNYEINTKNLYVTQDRDSIRFAILPYQKEITYIDRKKGKKIINDTVHIELNKNKLQAIYK